MDEDQIIIDGEPLTDISQLGGYNTLDKISARLHNIGTTGQLIGVYPTPWTKAIALGGGIALEAGDILDLINGRTNFGGLLGRTALNTAGVILPGSSSAKAIRTIGEGASKGTKVLINTSNRANQMGRALTKRAIEIAPNKYARYGLGVGLGAGMRYIPQGAFNNEGDNLLTGTLNAVRDDFENNPTEIAKIVALPLFLRNPRAAKVATAVEAGTQGATETGAASATTTGTTATEGATAAAGRTTNPVITSYAEGEGVPMITALLTAGGLGAASTVKGQTTQNKSKSSKQQNKPKTRPQTSTGTLTGRALPLTRGLILGRKTGGKLEILKELRK